MAVVILIEAVVIAALGVLACGLLRSHAEILATLRALETSAGTRPEASTSPSPSAPSPSPAVPSGGRPSPSPSAFDVIGTTVGGEAVKIGIVGARQSTLLAFLSGTGAACGPFWNAFAGADGVAMPGRARLVIVTRHEGEESPDRLRELAPPDVPVVLSGPAWQQYGVPAAPYFIYVDGPSGRIAGEGVAQSWGQVVSLWGQALDDATARTARD